MADPGTVIPAVLPGSSTASTAPPELWGSLLQSFGMLLLMLALLILVLWVIRKYSMKQGAGGRQGMIRMLASTYIAPKERVALLEVLGEKLLIGITPQQITFLARIEGDGGLVNTVAAEDEGGFFKSLLMRRLKGSSTSGDMKGEAHESSG